MAKTIESLRNCQIVGLDMLGENLGTVKRDLYNSDTIIIQTMRYFGIRFLGIDTTEQKIPLPGENSFTPLSDPRWDTFLSDPFASGELPYSAGLTTYLQDRTGPGVAANHKKLGDASEKLLEEYVQTDLNQMDVPKEGFAFYLHFAFEIMDRYGHFLCQINRYQPDSNVPSPRPPSYNIRMLKAGLASPYFIWPNINPWRERSSILGAVFAPGTANDIAQTDDKLRQARDAVKEARQNQVGIFDAADPLRIEPFEIRYMSRNTSPSRWVVDLSKNDNLLIHPENYYTIPFAEDRLFISSQHVPLFVEAG